MPAPAIQVGDEIRTRRLLKNVIGVVTKNDSENFCIILPSGKTYSFSDLSVANPIKTGKHYDVEGFLKSLQK